MSWKTQVTANCLNYNFDQYFSWFSNLKFSKPLLEWRLADTMSE
jgi:hypothetical protein